MTRTAEEIYQEFLDTLTPLFLAGDIEATLDHFVLPFRGSFPNVEFVCSDRQELAEMLSTFTQSLKERETTDLRRVVDAARFLSPTMIEGYHITEARSHGEAALEPIAVRNQLSYVDGLWRTIELTCILTPAIWPHLPSPTRPLEGDDL